MAGLVPAINVLQGHGGEKAWMPGTGPGMTLKEGRSDRCNPRRWAADRTPFTAEDSLRLWGMLINAGGLACDAVDLLFRTASSAAARKGQRIERYWRDCAMYRSHSSAQAATFASGIARVHFGLAMGMFGI